MVVDSGKDGTEELCRKYNVNYYYADECDSPGKARNFGIKRATGEVVAFLDSDCIAPKDWLTKIVDNFSKFPEIVGVLGKYGGGKNYIERVINKELINDRRETDFFLGFVEGNSAFKREIFEKGLKFGEFKYAEGNILAIQLKQRGYKTLKDYSLKVTHLGFPYTLRKWFKIGQAHYHNSRVYYKDFSKEALFSIFALSSLPIAGLSFFNSLLLIPFVCVNCIFGYFAIEKQSPSYLHSIPILPLLILMRWLLWFGFAYEWISRIK